MTPWTALVTALPPYSSPAVAQLDGLEGAGGGAARHGRPAEAAVVEDDLDLDGGVSAGVENLPGVDASIEATTTPDRLG